MEHSTREIDQILFKAAERGNLRKTEKCLSKGANILARNSHHTVLHSAVRSNSSTVIKFVLDNIKQVTKGNISLYIDAKDTEGDTPLMWAAEKGHVNAARILLESGADIEAKNKNGMTALHWAAKNNHKEVMKLLICKGASIDIKDKGGRTPTDYAKEEKHGEIAGYLAFSVSEMLRKQGKYDEAWLSYQEALDIQEVVLGPNHPDVLMTRHNMAVTLASKGKHSEALVLYQEVLDIQKRVDVLGPDHPDISKTRYNMAVSYINKCDSSEVLRIFREVLNIKDPVLGPDQPVPLTVNGDIVDSNSEDDRKEEQDSDEEIFEPKCDKTETLRKAATEHFGYRSNDVFIARGKEKGSPVWRYLLVDQGKTEKYLQQIKKDPLDVADCAKILFSGSGENPPQNTEHEVEEFFNKVSNDLFVIKEECENQSVYYYALIDQDKRKLCLEQCNRDLPLVKRIERCGKVLHSGFGQDPIEIISDRIVDAYFNINKRKLKEMFTELSFSSADKNGWSSLHDAAHIGNFQVAKTLTDGGANLNVKDAVCGRLPVHIAAREGHNDVIELFLNKGVKVNEADAKNWMPLHYAAWGGHFKTVKMLIKKGADIHSVEVTRGKKPIHVAAERGYKNIVNLFLRVGIDIDIPDKEGRTSLYYAAWRGHLNVVKNLAEKGADIHAENIRGVQPIHAAAKSGCKHIVEVLLDRGADVNDTDKLNQTPLHIATEHGHTGVVKFLIKKGANADVGKTNGETPLDSARGLGHKQIF